MNVWKTKKLNIVQIYVRLLWYQWELIYNNRYVTNYANILNAVRNKISAAILTIQNHWCKTFKFQAIDQFVNNKFKVKYCNYFISTYSSWSTNVCFSFKNCSTFLLKWLLGTNFFHLSNRLKLWSPQTREHWFAEEKQPPSCESKSWQPSTLTASG